MNFLVDFYFGLGFFFGFLNLYYLVNPKGLLGEPDSTSVSELSSYLLSSIFVRIPYLLWVIFGFLTSQWIVFLFLVGLGGVLYVFFEIFENNILQTLFLRTSLFFEFLLVGFVCLNHFHIGIKVSEFLL